MAVQGFDCSHYQGTINWPRVKADGIKFAYAKVIEGTAYPDATWPRNRAGALAVGIPIGGYYWAHPNLDPNACAAAFLSRLNQVSGMLQPILDIEHNGNPTSSPTGAGGVSPAAAHNWIHSFRAKVQARGYRLDIYTGAWFWNDYVDAADCSECAKSRLYLSRYASTMGPVPSPWTKAAVWQYTETGSVDGVPSTYEDQDVLVGTEQLSDLIYRPRQAANEEDDMPLNSDDKASIDHIVASHNSAMENKVQAMISAAVKELEHDLDASLESRISAHNASLESRLNDSIAAAIAKAAGAK